MDYNILRVCTWRLVVAALFTFGVQFASANNGPLVSGSYEVLHNTGRGLQAQVLMRIHLVNHGPYDLSIQRISLWDFSHPDERGSHACAVTLHAHASGETTQEFTIQRSDYRFWQQGVRPRFVLQVAGPGSTRSKTVVRLDRISGQEAK